MITDQGFRYLTAAVLLTQVSPLSGCQNVDPLTTPLDAGDLQERYGVEYREDDPEPKNDLSDALPAEPGVTLAACVDFCMELQDCPGAIEEAGPDDYADCPAMCALNMDYIDCVIDALPSACGAAYQEFYSCELTMSCSEVEALYEAFAEEGASDTVCYAEYLDLIVACSDEESDELIYEMCDEEIAVLEEHGGGTAGGPSLFKPL